jgi:hypothetical protein
LRKQLLDLSDARPATTCYSLRSLIQADRLASLVIRYLLDQLDAARQAAAEGAVRTKIKPSESSSSALIASVMKIIRFSFEDVSSSFPSIMPAGIPGIIDAILDNDPLVISD